MAPIDREAFTLLIKEARIKPRLRKILRFVPEEVTSWESRDFLVVTDKSGREGVLITHGQVFPFLLHSRTAKPNGRIEAVICDICASWRRGTESAVITFPSGERRSISYLVCADLDCSLHVRGLTDASKLSRTQIRESITPESRIRRLNDRLASLLDTI